MSQDSIPAYQARKIYKLNQMKIKKSFFRKKGMSSGTIVAAVVYLMIFQGCRQGRSSGYQEGIPEIRGIYGSPVPLWNKGLRLDELSVNSVFLNWHSIDEMLLERAESEEAYVYAEFPLLNGKDYVEIHPEAWAIDMYGNRVEPASWFMGVCPTEPGFREFRTGELKALLDQYDLKGIWLDYLHWHAQFEEPEPILPETCFCDHCIKTFESFAGINIPGSTTAEKAEKILTDHDSLWREWRCNIIAGWVKDMREIVKKHDPEMLLGIYHCPWDDNEFEGARRRILGLDYDLLRDVTDIFSPMVYHGRMGRDAEWVRDNIEWFCGRLGTEAGSFPKVWPIVQAYDDPYVITPGEFENVLRFGAVSGSTGVMMFTSYAVSQSELKIATLRKVYAEWAH